MSKEINGIYNNNGDVDTCFVVEKDNGYWYAFNGSSHANFTYNELFHGVNTLELEDVDTFTLSDSTINSIEDLERNLLEDEDEDERLKEIKLPFFYGVTKEDTFSKYTGEGIEVREADVFEKDQSLDLITFENAKGEWITIDDIYDYSTKFTDGEKTAYLSNNTFENLVAQVKEENTVNIENVKEKICEVFELEDLQINDQNLEMIEHFIEITNKTIEPKLSDTPLEINQKQPVTQKQ